MILKHCQDCEREIPVSEFYKMGGRYSTYCRKHKSIRDKAKYAEKKGGMVRKRYDRNSPRPCIRCSPDTYLPVEKFYRCAKSPCTVCMECIRFKVKLRHCGLTLEQVSA